MTKAIKILHITTHDEECGIGKYQQQFLRSMEQINTVENTIFEFSPNRTKLMSDDEFEPVFKQFCHQMNSHDILHIQHEFSFYAKDELEKYITEAKSQGKKVIITIHTSLNSGMPKLDVKELISTNGPRHLIGTRRLKSRAVKVHVAPIRKADLVLVHNSVTAQSLKKYGIRAAKVLKITMPVPELDFKLRSTDVSRHLRKQPDDILICTVGFLSENKGMRDSIQALRLLPPNYKLAMIGGAHPSGANDAFCNEMEGLVVDLGLEERVYITGYVKRDELLNAMIRECDICIYPFHQPYYSGVTSASLNNSLANYKPAVTYPTKPILEMNAEMPAVITCKSFEYSELAKELQKLDIKKQSEIATKYARAFSYSNQAQKVASIYTNLYNSK
jgi:glycosyltransferase involved in cell wall biosynthesis